LALLLERGFLKLENLQTRQGTFVQPAISLVKEREKAAVSRRQTLLTSIAWPHFDETVDPNRWPLEDGIYYRY
jgi:hypothetical protein